MLDRAKTCPVLSHPWVKSLPIMDLGNSLQVEYDWTVIVKFLKNQELVPV